MANIINWREKLIFSTGDTIAVHQIVEDKGKKRTQIFEGIVIRIRGHKGLKSFTVRKIGANNIGVEKIFPESTPVVSKIELKKKGRIRRAVLNYLRDRVGKKAKVKDIFIKKDKTEKEDEIVVDQVKIVKLTEEQRLAEKQKQAAKETKIKEKEKKKKKRPAKIVRKERKFVR
jgi:large subunit ribosomal protein L19